MISILIFMSFPYLIFGDSFDADLDICSKTSLDAAVYSDDGFTYVFKGDYFWQTHPLYNSSGTIGFGNLTTSKWPDVKGRIKAVFVAKVGGTLITIFVVNDSWIGYGKGIKLMEGKTSSWPGFDGLQVTTIVQKSRDSSIGFVLHSANKKYTAFNFTVPVRPKTLLTNLDTWVRDKTVFFIDERLNVSKASYISKDSLDTLLDVKASICYDQSLVLIGTDKYCVINLNQKLNEKTCDPKGPTSTLIGCPINTEGRPSAPKQSVADQGHLDSGKSGLNISGPKEDNRTVVNPTTPFNGTDAIDVNKSTLYAIVFNVTLLCVTIVVVIVIVVISKITNKQTKGEDYYIK